jgi:hypothetical protein
MTFARLNTPAIWLALTPITVIRHTSEVNTLVLLAPFLGSETLINSITTANGLEHWLPNDTDDEKSLQAIWLRLKDKPSSGTEFPELYLGSGSADKFRQAHALLASTLPEDHVFTVAGGHNWTSWKQLWKQMLDENILCSVATDTDSSPASYSAPALQ